LQQEKKGPQQGNEGKKLPVLTKGRKPAFEKKNPKNT
jgi:hypothetical protein